MDIEFKKIVAKVLRIPYESLTEESNAQNTKNWDSFAFWSIIGELEEAYDIEFKMDDAVRYKTLGELYQAVKQMS